MGKPHILAGCCILVAGGIILTLGLLASRLKVPGKADEHALQPSQALADPLQSYVDEFAPGEYRACERQENEYLQSVPRKREPQELTVNCELVAKAPRVDGKDEDDAWSAAEPVTTLDYLSQRPIVLKAVHTSGSIFFLVKYPDAAPSTTHKSFRWDETEDVYKLMDDREDAFVFRWSRSGPDADILLRHGRPHKVDVWFWKAWRTNPVAYADDKWESLSDTPGSDTQKIEVPGQPTMYLRRQGDTGHSAYEERLVLEYSGPFASRFAHRLPSGSRGDLRAKGIWRDGIWTIEFSRKLETGHMDDVAFKTGGSYLFVVSCYETAGCKVNPSLSQPLYNAGDGFDRLILKIPRGQGK